MDLGEEEIDEPGRRITQRRASRSSEMQVGPHRVAAELKHYRERAITLL
jgi:hypothetical protein